MPTWTKLLANEKSKHYYQDTLRYIAQCRNASINVYPTNNNIFTALSTTPFEQVKVVILGQDPYHAEGQAHGLSFSVQKGVKIPPSLRNIFKELAVDIEGFTLPKHGNLQTWAEQGVLLLNTVLTVEQGKAHSHKNLGWEQYTDKIIELINKKLNGVIFLLWGSHAQIKGQYINSTKHTVLTAPHPSPLSAYRGFFGCKHFSKANQLLIAQGKTPINWQV